MHCKMRSHTGYISLIYLHCVFSNEPLTRWPEWMHSYIALVAVVWLFSTVGFQMNLQITWPWECVVTYVAFIRLFSSHTGHICSTFLHCVFSSVSSNYLPHEMQMHTGDICLTFVHCVFLSDPGVPGVRSMGPDLCLSKMFCRLNWCDSLPTWPTYLTYLPTWRTYQTYIPDLLTWPTYLT